MNKRTQKTRNATAHEGEITFEESSGNVFDDLGFPDADEMLVKADIAIQISRIIKGAGFSQAQAAKILGVDQPKVSMLTRGRLKDFSIDRLLRFLVRLGRDVVIVTSEPRHEGHARLRVSRKLQRA